MQQPTYEYTQTSSPQENALGQGLREERQDQRPLACATMASRVTRSASRSARRAEAVVTGPLGALSHDELGVIFDGLADPLLPIVAVALSSTCLGLRTPLLEALQVLEERHLRAMALCRKFGMSCAELCVAEWLRESDLQSGTTITTDDMATLNMVLRTNGLPRLEKLHLMGLGLGDADVSALFEALVLPNQHD